MRGPGRRRLQGARRRLIRPRLGLALAGLVLGLVAPAPGADASDRSSGPKPPSPAGRAWLLVDADDGERLASSDASGSFPMASTTKLMTAYLAMRRLSLHDTVVAPAYHPMLGESLMGLRPGEHVTVHDLLYGLLLPSGNDAAATLADAIAGSTPAFVTEMNREARRLGLEDTSYANPIGLDESGNYSSAKDLVTLTLRLRREPLFRRIVNTPSANLAGANPPHVVNHNDLVREVPWVNGVKTGYTLGARYVLVASARRKGVELVSVLMGAPSIAARDEGSLSLLRYGFSLYHRMTAIHGRQRLGRVRVPNGEAPVPLVPARAVDVTARRDQAVDVRLDSPPMTRAPVRRGERLGFATVTVDGARAGRVPALAAHRVRVEEADRSVVARLDGRLPGPRWVVWAAGAVVLLMVSVAAVTAITSRGSR
jgi:D-alanyl-D-alanine carboxypeptidase (penicillin-binding protein 5/6)